MMDRLPEGSVVGLSVSDPDDLAEHGIGLIHVKHAFVELVRHLLSAGGTIAYGGDLRETGYTEQLFDLVRTYAWDDDLDAARVRSHLAWHVADLPAAERARWKPIATFVAAARPQDDGGPPPPPRAEQTAADRWRAYLGFRQMREELADDVTAQILLGGRRTGQTGLLPGIVEEASLALERGKAIYPLAGFGGAAALVVRAMQGSVPDELTLDHQLEHGDDTFRAMVDSIGRDEAAARTDAIVQGLVDAPWSELANGLTPEENEVLATSRDMTQIMVLLLRGLALGTG